MPTSAHQGPTLDEYFAAEFTKPARTGTFDMVDEPDLPQFTRFPRLHDAVQFLDTQLRPSYEAADRAALRHQRTHRAVANIAIVGGGLAIGFAIVQLALKQSGPTLAHYVAGLEAVAVIIGVTAVLFGLKARFDHQWLLQRHIAERLRMLKFQAFGQSALWEGNIAAWQKWVLDQRAAIKSISTIQQVKDWVFTDRVQGEPLAPSSTVASADDIAIATYYRRKRADFQAAYFDRQSHKLSRGSRWLHPAGLPLFFISTLAVLVHFAVDLMGGGAESHSTATGAHGLELVGIWALTCAALLPVLSLCMRAWMGAFEYSRSAHLFKAKQRVLADGSVALCADQANCALTVRRIAFMEHTLEQEHREWLRLLIEAEWFL
jgi:hypothetical protein